MSDRSSSSSERPRRRRRTPQSARRAILDAAADRLRRDGPDGLRLQAIAADLGIAHSSILHHFGSRDGLLEALAQDAFEALDRELRADLEGSSGGDRREHASALLERIARTLGDEGHARLLAWRLISGRAPSATGDDADASEGLLTRIADAVHRQRIDALDPDATLEDTRLFVVWMACSLFGEALAGELMLASAGLDASEAGRRRFRRWLASRGRTMLGAADPEDAAD